MYQMYELVVCTEYMYRLSIIDYLLLINDHELWIIDYFLVIFDYFIFFVFS